jgi:trk system potassium uptake protein TrkA
MKRFLVIGLGRFGRAVAEGLADAGGEVIAVDTDLALVEAVRDRVTVAAQIDAVEADALRELGAADVDAAVVAIGEEFAAEILAVAILKELGIREIVARSGSEREHRILGLVGATRVMSVEVEMGQRLARSLAATDVLDHVPLGDGLSVIACKADERVIGTPLDASGLRDRWRLTLLAVRPAGGGKLDAPPEPDYVFREGDVLLLAGTDARLAGFTKGRRG